MKVKLNLGFKNLLIVVLMIGTIFAVGCGRVSKYEEIDSSNQVEINNEQEDVNSEISTNGKKAVNIEGVITEVSKDGKKLKVDKQWIIINEKTIMGITGPTAASKEEQLFEDEFEVGNSIAGFTLDDTSKKEVIAYAIYTNVKWEK